MSDLNTKTSEILKNNPKTIGKGALVNKPTVEVKSSGLPSYVKCCVCGKPPIGADWLKPVSPNPFCRTFVHLSHIKNGPGVSEQAGFILRNA